LKIIIGTDEHRRLWDETVTSTSHGTLFHMWKWLKIVEAHTSTRLYPLMAFKGTELVALYPVFIQKKGFVSVAFSPPSHSYLLYLGPVIAQYDSMKQDKKESIYLHLQEEINRYLFSVLGCKYFRVRSSPGIYDSRPLMWTGFIVEPQYTYRINLSLGVDQIWNRFDRKLRVDLNKAKKEQVDVKQGGLEDLLFIADSLSRRFREQGFTPKNYVAYLTDLYHAFHPENLKIFVAYHNGERIGGMVSLCFKRIMYLWIGISKSDNPGLSPNDLVQWEAIQWACHNGFDFYEEMDGGVRRLRGFKAKYNPDLEIWYSAVKYSSSFYQWIENVSRLKRR